MTRNLVNRSMPKAFWWSECQNAVETAVQKILAKPLIATDEATGKIHLTVSTVVVATIGRNEVEKRSLEKFEMGRYRKLSKMAVVRH